MLLGTMAVMVCPRLEFGVFLRGQYQLAPFGAWLPMRLRVGLPPCVMQVLAAPTYSIGFTSLRLRTHLFTEVL